VNPAGQKTTKGRKNSHKGEVSPKKKKNGSKWPNLKLEKYMREHWVQEEGKPPRTRKNKKIRRRGRYYSKKNV